MKKRSGIDLQELIQLTKRMDIAENAFIEWLEHVPAVVWCKDYSDGGRMLFISREYRRLWPNQAADYVGKVDDQVWPAHVAEQFRANDLEVLRSHQIIERIEETPGAAEPGWERTLVLKFPIWHSDSPQGDPHMVGGIGLKMPTGDFDGAAAE